MSSLTPAEVIKFRAECYLASDGGGVFAMYSPRSDLRRIFTEADFVEHFRFLTKNSEHAGVQIVSETVKSNLAEVKYIEHINENGELVTFYSKSVLAKEGSRWLILKEMREKRTV